MGEDDREGDIITIIDHFVVAEVVAGGGEVGRELMPTMTGSC